MYVYPAKSLFFTQSSVLQAFSLKHFVVLESKT